MVCEYDGPDAKVEKRKNDIVNRLVKTKTESYPDLAMERVGHRGHGSLWPLYTLQSYKPPPPPPPPPFTLVSCFTKEPLS